MHFSLGTLGIWVPAIVHNIIWFASPAEQYNVGRSVFTMIIDCPLGPRTTPPPTWYHTYIIIVQSGVVCYWLSGDALRGGDGVKRVPSLLYYASYIPIPSVCFCEPASRKTVCGAAYLITTAVYNNNDMFQWERGTYYYYYYRRVILSASLPAQ